VTDAVKIHKNISGKYIQLPLPIGAEVLGRHNYSHTIRISNNKLEKNNKVKWYPGKIADFDKYKGVYQINYDNGNKEYNIGQIISNEGVIQPNVRDPRICIYFLAPPTPQVWVVSQTPPHQLIINNSLGSEVSRFPWDNMKLKALTNALNIKRNIIIKFKEDYLEKQAKYTNDPNNYRTRSAAIIAARATTTLAAGVVSSDSWPTRHPPGSATATRDKMIADNNQKMFIDLAIYDRRVHILKKHKLSIRQQWILANTVIKRLLNGQEKWLLCLENGEWDAASQKCLMAERRHDQLDPFGNPKAAFKCRPGDDKKGWLLTYGNGKYYRGCQFKTHSGKECINWTKAPKTDQINTALLGEQGNHNYCRNPDNSGVKRIPPCTARWRWSWGRWRRQWHCPGIRTGLWCYTAAKDGATAATKESCIPLSDDAATSNFNKVLTNPIEYAKYYSR
jgi:hypothetical protein